MESPPPHTRDAAANSIAAMIQRFRTDKPTSRAERMKQREQGRLKEMWWVNSPTDPLSQSSDSYEGFMRDNYSNNNGNSSNRRRRRSAPTDGLNDSRPWPSPTPSPSPPRPSRQMASGGGNNTDNNGNTGLNSICRVDEIIAGDINRLLRASGTGGLKGRAANKGVEPAPVPTKPSEAAPSSLQFSIMHRPSSAMPQVRFVPKPGRPLPSAADELRRSMENDEDEFELRRSLGFDAVNSYTGDVQLRSDFDLEPKDVSNEKKEVETAKQKKDQESSKSALNVTAEISCDLDMVMKNLHECMARLGGDDNNVVNTNIDYEISLLQDGENYNGKAMPSAIREVTESLELNLQGFRGFAKEKEATYAAEEKELAKWKAEERLKIQEEVRIAVLEEVGKNSIERNRILIARDLQLSDDGHLLGSDGDGDGEGGLRRFVFGRHGGGGGGGGGGDSQPPFGDRGLPVGLYEAEIARQMAEVARAVALRVEAIEELTRISEEVTNDGSVGIGGHEGRSPLVNEEKDGERGVDEQKEEKKEERQQVRSMTPGGAGRGGGGGGGGGGVLLFGDRYGKGPVSLKQTGQDIVADLDVTMQCMQRRLALNNNDGGDGGGGDDGKGSGAANKVEDVVKAAEAAAKANALAKQQEEQKVQKKLEELARAYEAAMEKDLGLLSYSWPPPYHYPVSVTAPSGPVPVLPNVLPEHGYPYPYSNLSPETGGKGEHPGVGISSPPYIPPPRIPQRQQQLPPPVYLPPGGAMYVGASIGATTAGGGRGGGSGDPTVRFNLTTPSAPPYEDDSDNEGYDQRRQKDKDRDRVIKAAMAVAADAQSQGPLRGYPDSIGRVREAQRSARLQVEVAKLQRQLEETRHLQRQQQIQIQQQQRELHADQDKKEKEQLKQAKQQRRQQRRRQWRVGDDSDSGSEGDGDGGFIRETALLSARRHLAVMEAEKRRRLRQQEPYDDIATATSSMMATAAAMGLVASGGGNGVSAMRYGLPIAGGGRRQQERQLAQDQDSARARLDELRALRLMLTEETASGAVLP